jgi:hypothetical protein
MSNDQPRERTKADADLEREVRAERKFSLAEAIGRLAGPGAMKGESPVTRKRQAEAELQEYLNRHLADFGGVLRGILLRHVAESELLLSNLDQPLIVLAAFINRILDTEYLLKEIVREADAEWGQLNQQRPYFQQEGRLPHPDDPYTSESVRCALSHFAAELRRSMPAP